MSERDIAGFGGGPGIRPEGLVPEGLVRGLEYADFIGAGTEPTQLFGPEDCQRISQFLGYASKLIKDEKVAYPGAIGFAVGARQTDHRTSVKAYPIGRTNPAVHNGTRDLFVCSDGMIRGRSEKTLIALRYGAYGSLEHQIGYFEDGGEGSFSFVEISLSEALGYIAKRIEAEPTRSTSFLYTPRLIEERNRSTGEMITRVVT